VRPARARRLRAARWALSLLVWAALAGLYALDAHAPRGVVHADVFSAIWAGISFIANLLGTVGGAIATSLEAVVAYLVTAVSWLASRVASLLFNTGGMFAKAWDGLKIVWRDVLKPALTWVDHELGRLHDWLVDTFKPVFQFLKRVQDELNAIYKRFVRPILDTIDFIRAINRVLLTFHIHLLEALDKVLQQIEQRIEEPFLWINQQLTRIWNLFDLIITFDGLYQRLTLLKSLRRYEPHWFALWWNDQVDPAKKSGSDYDRTRIFPLDAPWANGKELAQFYRGEGSRMDADVAELVPLWRLAAGIDPPTGDYG